MNNQTYINQPSNEGLSFPREMILKGFLRKFMVCDCGLLMTLQKYDGSIDGLALHCRIGHSPRRKSIRKGSTFASSKLSLVKMVQLIELLAVDVQVEQAAELAKVGRKTIGGFGCLLGN